MKTGRSFDLNALAREMVSRGEAKDFTDARHQLAVRGGQAAARRRRIRKQQQAAPVPAGSYWWNKD